MRNGTSFKKAATKKCPDPQQGSRTFKPLPLGEEFGVGPCSPPLPSLIGDCSKSCPLCGQLSPPLPSLIGGGERGWLASASRGREERSEVLSNHSTIYGSVKSCVTAGSSLAPILTSASLTLFFRFDCQN